MEKRKAMRRLLFLSFVLFLTTLPIASGEAQPAAPHAKKSDPSRSIPKLPPVMTTYDIYVGGLHFLTAEILFEEESGRYKTHLHAHTAGYLYKVLKWDGDVSSSGRIKGN